MADAVTLRYIYPPNFQDSPNWPEHPDHGVDGAQFTGPKRYILHLTNISDGTGESLVNKFTLADHRGVTGKVLRRTVIEWIEYDVFGMDVSLFWDRTPSDVTMVRLPGGATTTSGKIRGPLYDPGTGDGTDLTGDILLSTVNAASGDSYNIRMCIRGKEHPKPGMTLEQAESKAIFEVPDRGEGAGTVRTTRNV
ncbi:MAG: hypothetical protein ACXABY_32535 [Candidatus Thorarchaeota archaeon]|jgi:hypothetical protein